MNRNTDGLQLGVNSRLTKQTDLLLVFIRLFLDWEGVFTCRPRRSLVVYGLSI